MLKSSLLALFVTISAVSTSGCEVHRHTSCGDVPEAAIEEFEVTIGTGDDSCDCDVQFCFKRYSSHEKECGLLDAPLHDDFEPWETNTYLVLPHGAVDVGDLETFEIVNTNCGFFNTTLSVSWVEIYAIDHFGYDTLLFEEEFYPYETYYEDEALTPDSCQY